jgi:hypothetical protein
MIMEHDRKKSHKIIDALGTFRTGNPGKIPQAKRSNNGDYRSVINHLFVIGLYQTGIRPLSVDYIGH